MITFELVINPIIVAAAVVGGVLIGFILGKGKLAKTKYKVLELENDLVSRDAEILDIQKAYVQLERKFNQTQTSPVIPMKLNGKETNPKEKASK